MSDKVVKTPTLEEGLEDRNLQATVAQDAQLLLEEAILLASLSNAKEPMAIVGRALTTLVMALIVLAKEGGAKNSEGLKKVLDIVWNAGNRKVNAKGGAC